MLNHYQEVAVCFICRHIKSELSAVRNQQAELQNLTEKEKRSGLKLNESDLEEYKAIRKELALQTSILRQNMAGLECQLSGKQASSV